MDNKNEDMYLKYNYFYEYISALLYWDSLYNYIKYHPKIIIKVLI